MKTYYDNNFLNGTLSIVVVENGELVLGSLVVHENDAELVFKAKAQPQGDDVFSEKKGIEIVKNKLALKYYTYWLTEANSVARHLSKTLESLNQDIKFFEKKKKNIETYLSKDHELVFKKRKTTKRKKK